MSNQTFQQPVETEFFEKGSRFIGLGYPCESIKEFQSVRSDLQNRYSDANHITFAYAIKDGDTIHTRSSDDGEPSGTAGKPILNHIDGNNLLNSVIFVVRYFGGVKLGAGGLVRAYSQSARLVVQNADLVEFLELEIIEFETSYENQRQLEYDLKKFERIKVINREFSEQLKYQISIPKIEKEIFLEKIGVRPIKKPGV